MRAVVHLPIRQRPRVLDGQNLRPARGLEGQAADIQVWGDRTISSANVWINGEPLGRMWQWPDGNIIIPERVLKKGGENRITWLIQPPSSQEWGRLATSPSVSADLSRSAFQVTRLTGPSIHISDLKRSCPTRTQTRTWEDRRCWEERFRHGALAGLVT